MARRTVRSRPQTAHPCLAWDYISGGSAWLSLLQTCPIDAPVYHKWSLSCMDARELVDARHDAGRRWPETEIRRGIDDADAGHKIPLEAVPRTLELCQ